MLSVSDERTADRSDRRRYATVDSSSRGNEFTEAKAVIPAQAALPSYKTLIKHQNFWLNRIALCSLLCAFSGGR